MSDKVLRTRRIPNEDRLEAIIALLRAEVRAWRNASDNYTGDVRIVYGQAGHIETIAAARAATDAAKALEDK